MVTDRYRREGWTSPSTRWGNVEDEWVSEGADHVGTVGLLFVDGWLGWRYEGDLVVVDRAPGGALRKAEATLRPGNEAVAWQAGCSCGWLGSALSLDLFHRPGPVPSRRGRGAQVLPPVGVVRLARDEWDEHTDPAVVLAAVRQAMLEHRRAKEALDTAVARARSVGLSWADVGAATGMTRQSANERWSKKPPL